MNRVFCRAVIAATAFQLIADLAAAQQLTILHSFNQQKLAHGYEPFSGVVVDPTSGSLFGTTAWGGNAASPCIPNGCGTAYAVLLNRKGQLKKLHTLHAFQPQSGDGAQPLTNLSLDTQGNLYGTTLKGGDLTCPDQTGCGVVFMLWSGSRRSSHEKILHAFHGHDDGAYPRSDLLVDPATGTLYGTTSFEGAHNGGTVFSLTPNADKSVWTYSVILTFDGAGGGSSPAGALTQDNNGALYGVTVSGGDPNCNFGMGCGTVFKLEKSGSSWHETVLHAFNESPTEGLAPETGIVLDNAGNVFGTTVTGGSNSTDCEGGACGTVFKLTKSNNWAETVLHAFQFDEGGRPTGGRLAIDEAGDLFGELSMGGPNQHSVNEVGAVYKLQNNAGAYTYVALHNFCSASNCADGQTPIGGVVFDSFGSLYGTTLAGGKFNAGEVFKIAP